MNTSVHDDQSHRLGSSPGAAPQPEGLTSGEAGEDQLDWGPAQSRLVEWHDPRALAHVATQRSGLEFLQGIVDGAVPPPPIAQVFGTRLVSVAPGEAVFSCEPDEIAYNTMGLVHGGWMCTLLDTAAGCALHTLLPAGAGYASIEIKVSFLQAVRAGAGAVEFRGRVLREGRRIAFAEADARTVGGELVGHATSSLAVVRRP